jgi:CubicO group peptidase (beta-lactamase class C family)
MYAYADYNGALFGCLIEAISKQSVQNYLNNKVFKPLGLTAAYSPVFLPAGTVCKDLLKKNGKVKEKLKNSDFVKLSGKWYYLNSSGVMLANCSQKIGSKTYKFDKSGVCLNP